MELIKHYIEIIRNIDIHRLNDEELEIILKDFTERYQALQLQQTGVIKSVCGNCEQKKLYIKKQCYCGYCGDRLKT
jgi:formate dehydrogenase assembly factor FdhD